MGRTLIHSGGNSQWQVKTKIESVEGVERAKAAFLSAAKIAFPELPNPNIKAIVNELHRLLKLKAEKLSKIDDARKSLLDKEQAALALLGESPKVRMSELTTNAMQASQAVNSVTNARDSFLRYLATESSLIAIFDFLPSIAKK